MAPSADCSSFEGLLCSCRSLHHAPGGMLNNAAPPTCARPNPGNLNMLLIRKRVLAGVVRLRTSRE